MSKITKNLKFCCIKVLTLQNRMAILRMRKLGGFLKGEDYEKAFGCSLLCVCRTDVCCL